MRIDRQNSILGFCFCSLAEGCDNVLEIVPEMLEKAIKDFYKITGLKVTFYDKDRNIVFSYPYENQDFCEVLGECLELRKECYKCDTKAMDICQKTKEPYIYTCHMNLMEGVNPIIISGEFLSAGLPSISL